MKQLHQVTGTKIQVDTMLGVRERGETSLGSGERDKNIQRTGSLDAQSPQGAIGKPSPTSASPMVTSSPTYGPITSYAAAAAQTWSSSSTSGMTTSNTGMTTSNTGKGQPVRKKPLTH